MELSGHSDKILQVVPEQKTITRFFFLLSKIKNSTFFPLLEIIHLLSCISTSLTSKGKVPLTFERAYFETCFMSL